MKWFLLFLILLSAAWFVYWHSCREYDKDLEKDFIREVGKTYKQAGFREVM